MVRKKKNPLKTFLIIFVIIIVAGFSVFIATKLTQQTIIGSVPTTNGYNPFTYSYSRWYEGCSTSGASGFCEETDYYISSTPSFLNGHLGSLNGQLGYTINRIADGQLLDSCSDVPLTHYEDDIIKVDENVYYCRPNYPIKSDLVLSLKLPIAESTPIQTYYYEGASDNEMRVKVNSKISREVKLWAWIGQIGNNGEVNYINDLSRDAILTTGEQEFKFTLPQNLHNGDYYFFFVPVDKTPFIGNKYYPNSGQCSWCSTNEYLQLDYLKSQLFQIIPRPLYIRVTDSNDCPTGYTFQEGDSNLDTDLCIRNDLGSLTCVQLGCPVTELYTYECSSSGMCVEKVFQSADCETNDDCDSGEVCDAETGVCYTAEIYNILVQCQVPSDCGIPCMGITTNCVDNKCDWIGECEPIYVYSEVDCRDVGCTEGYECNTVNGGCYREVWKDCRDRPCVDDYTCNTNDGLCYRDITIDCRTNGCPEEDTQCNTANGVCYGENTIIIYQNSTLDCRDFSCYVGYKCDKTTGGCYKETIVNNTITETVTVTDTITKTKKIIGDWWWIFAGLFVGIIIALIIKKGKKR